MLIKEAKEILKTLGYKVIKEDTDDWDEADLGINSYADEKERKKIMNIHKKGKHYDNHNSWHYRDLHTKVNHASYAAGHAAEDKILEAMKKEFTVQINKQREWGVNGKLSYNGDVLKFDLTSNYKFTFPDDENKNNFKTNSHIVSVKLSYLGRNEIFEVNVEKPEEIEKFIEEIKARFDEIFK